MRYVRPDYFDDFQCTAGKCTDTCCAGWQIMIDSETLNRYTEDASDFKDRLLGGIDWNEGSFCQYDGRCAMLNENNLCDLILAEGQESLCETCRRYPRHVEEFEGVREWSLSLSCPTAARLMLEREQPVRFLIDEDGQEDELWEEFEDFDCFLYTQLTDARGVLFGIVQNRSYPMECRMKAVLELAGELQRCIDENRLYDMDSLIQCFEGERVSVVKESPAERYEVMKKSFAYLEQLELLREDWAEVLQMTRTTLYEGGYEQYRNIYEAFQEQFAAWDSGNDKEKKWQSYLENLLIFFLYTYFCGAVYDECVYSKAALSVYSVRYLQEFVMCSWFLADKHIDMYDCVRLAYRYAREVEHSDENLNLLEELFLQEWEGINE